MKQIITYFDDEENRRDALTELFSSGIVAEEICPFGSTRSSIKIEGKRTVSYIALVGAILGLFLATLLIWWTSSVDYPVDAGGKPDFSIAASLPVLFEISVLFAALGIFTYFIIKIITKKRGRNIIKGLNEMMLISPYLLHITRLDDEKVEKAAEILEKTKACGYEVYVE